MKRLELVVIGGNCNEIFIVLHRKYYKIVIVYEILEPFYFPLSYSIFP